MKKYLFIIIAYYTFTSYALPIDITEARLVAINYFHHKNPKKSWVGINQTKITNYKGITTRYTFIMDNNSFIVVSSDNSTVPILVYSDNGTFNEDHSPSFDFWMQTEYDELIVYNRTNNVSNQNTIQQWENIKNKNFIEDRSINSVSPLIKTKWGQMYPNDAPPFESSYNYYVQSSSCGSGHCAAGCVATAMAQIMKYWQDTDNNFDWCNMPNELITTSTHYYIQRNAVAELIADCGDKAEMDYCSNGCSSSSTIWKARQAFRHDYDYSNDMDRRYRWLTPWWKRKMRKSLDRGQPILYGGQSSDAGHAFVCDGYNGRNYFHFNWGWRGSNDGYFYIKSNDGDPVIDYHKWQEAVFYLHPTSSSTYCVDCNENITVSNDVTADNPYNSEFPYIQWSGISSLYNYSSVFPYPNNKPLLSDIISENGETRLEYYDITSGTIHSNNAIIPDKVNVHFKAYNEIVLTNFLTEEGAIFTAKITSCPNSSGSVPQRVSSKIKETNVEIIDKDNKVIKLYPNPTKNILTIESTKDVENWVITDAYGKIYYRGDNSTQTIDMSNLPKGIYFLKAILTNGKTVMKKVIKN